MIKACLFDLDGVFYISDRILQGSNQTIDWLKYNKIPYKFITNTTTLSRLGLANKLSKLGLNICVDDIVSASYAGALYLKKIKPKSCKLILKEEAKNDYQQFNINNQNPEFIIIGDIGDNWSFQLMNELCNNVLNGSKMIALHKGRYFQTDNGLQIDAGAFITGLEHATKTQAHIIGKPSQSFFELAMQDFNISSKEIALVGDDIYNDIQGANQKGLFSVLVKTGKYREKTIKSSGIVPKLTINSIADFPKIMTNYIK
tara:strand:+ start:823 stop:1596 length:774 start_codon:yes stop_codon:yes gene_type:complete